MCEHARSARLAGRARLFLLRNRGPGRRGSSLCAVGRRRGHHDQSGRPRAAAQTRRACHPTAFGPTPKSLRASRRGWDSNHPFRPTRPQSLTNCAAPPRVDSRITPASPTNASSAKTASSGPARDVNHPGTPRLFLDRFCTDDGLARFHAVDLQPPAEEPDHEYPLYLTTGRIMAQYQSGTQTRRVPALLKSSPEAFFEIHPSMARNYGIANRRRRAAGHSPRQRRHGRPADPGHSHGHDLRAISFRRVRAAPTC